MEDTKTEQQNKKDYNKAVKILNISKKEQIDAIESEHKQAIIAAKEQFNILPKDYASNKELVIMIGYVLETGKNGTKAISYCAETKQKTTNWIKDVAKQKVNDSFKQALMEYENNAVILAMIENKIYCEKDIFNKTVTGALTKLSNQMKVSKQIDTLKARIVVLEQSLADRKAGNDWKPEALKLSEAGKSIREIAAQLGVSKSTAGDFLKKKK